MNTFAITLISAVFFPSNTYTVYCKSMILILDTIEDEEICWDKDNICAINSSAWYLKEKLASQITEE